MNRRMVSLSNRRRAVTMVETLVSIAIMSMLLAMSAGTMALGARAFHSFRLQNRSQLQAGMAMEHLANLLRNATTYEPCAGDDPANGPLPCVRFAIPVDGDVYSLAWGTVKFVEPAEEQDNSEVSYKAGKIQVVWDPGSSYEKTEGSWFGGNKVMPGILDFAVRFESSQRVEYRIVFPNFSGRNRGSDRLEDSVLQTQVTAKNHILLEGLGLGGENETIALRF